jgi:hypothetical protein
MFALSHTTYFGSFACQPIQDWSDIVAEKERGLPEFELPI